MSALIEAQDLSLHYTHRGARVRALDGVNLRIGAGERVAITGPSGSGKSTLLGLVSGFLKPTGGLCRVAGQSLATLDAGALARFRAETLGFVFQQASLLPHLNLLDNVLLGVDHLRRERAQWLARGRELLEQVGLAAEQTRFPHEVSGGQAQRAAIARALLRGPQLLLADEPTGSLDEATADDMLRLLDTLCAQGCTLVVVTHSDKVAAAMQRQVRLQAGRLLEAEAAC